MSSGSLTAATPETGGGRAFRPGPRTALAVAMAAAVVIAAVLVVALNSGGGAATRGGGAATRSHVTKYGQLPGWLPKITNTTTKLEVARAASPVLHEEQGYTVHAVLPRGTTNITAVGPEIPGWVASADQTGKLPDGKSVPGKFIVTVIDAGGTIPVSAGAFTILTDAGKIVRTKVAVMGGGRLPMTLHPGQHINLAVQGGVVEGSGSIRWAPLGRKVLVGWIYQVEFD